VLAPGFLRLRLALKGPGALPHLDVGQHLKLFAPNYAGSVPGEWNGQPDPEYGQGEEVARRYTPVLSNEEEGWYDVVVELITPARAPPDGGKFGRFAADLSVGSTVQASAPHGVYRYLGAGRFMRRGGGAGPAEMLQVQDLGLICAGVASNTALTLAGAILRDPCAAGLRIWVVAVGRTEETLMHRGAFEQFASEHPERFHVWFVLEKSAPAEWPYGSGNIADALVPCNLPPAGESTLLCTFGTGKVKQACRERFPELGYGSSGPGGAWWHWNEELD